MILQHLEKQLKRGKPGHLEIEISSTDRTLGTIFGTEITRLHGNTLPDDTYVIHCTGGGGQSFGAFIPKGLTLEVEGDSNDYFGKGLSGGKLIIYPPRDSRFAAEENIIIGNVALYGATSGRAFIRGIAGERFCVRNSGASAVCEGVGDHGCEYMTGGCVVVLGQTGKNFAAGMSGGVAYVLDEKHDLYRRVNKELVSIELVTKSRDIDELRELIEAHYKATGSVVAARILSDFDGYLPAFKKIMPVGYQRMLQGIAHFEELGETREQAELDAFYANAAN